MTENEYHLFGEHFDNLRKRLDKDNVRVIYLLHEPGYANEVKLLSWKLACYGYNTYVHRYCQMKGLSYMKSAIKNSDLHLVIAFTSEHVEKAERFNLDYYRIFKGEGERDG